MRIDAHCHAWVVSPERYPWQPVGGYLPQQDASGTILLKQMDAACMDRAVLVQPTPYGWNNAYLLDVVRQFPDRFRVVCLVNPFAQDSPQLLAQMVHNHGVKGVRFNWNLDTDHCWDEDILHQRIWSTALDLGIPVCLQLANSQVPQVERLARRFPKLRIVLDHLGRPVPGSAPDSELFLAFLALAKLPNCYAKLSGLYYFSKQPVPYADAWPLLKASLHAFGANRCLWGSDFPFILDRWSYEGWLNTIQDQVGFSVKDLGWILGDTATSLGW
jgi:predicted TIM-barrel fold metal-dependent hydrolase